MRWLRGASLTCVLVGAVLGAGSAEAQVIVDGFDGYETGMPPPWFWWNYGMSGTTLVDDAFYRGVSGKSVRIERTVFDGGAFAFGQGFWPVAETVELTYFFLVGSSDPETLSAFGRNNANNQIAWWVTVGGNVPNAIATYSDAGGWNHVMDVSPVTWYGVELLVHMGTSTYDITVWEDANPSNTVTEYGIDFRNGAAVGAIDQIQFGDFNASTTPHASAAYVDDVRFFGPVLFMDGFESGTTDSWLTVNP